MDACELYILIRHLSKNKSMSKKKIYVLGSIVILIGAYFIYNAITNSIEDKKHRQWVESLTHTASENVQVLTDTITVEYLDKKRTLSLYLPEDYQTDSVSYPVIYFLDGQSLFDQKVHEGTEWQVDEVLDSLTRLDIGPSIIVGIYSSEARMKEYKPFPSTRWYSDKVVSGDKHA